MKTLRIGKEIFTADYISHIGEVNFHFPPLRQSTFLTMTQAICGVINTGLPSVNFSVYLVTGVKVVKHIDFNSIDSETISRANKKIKEIKVEFGLHKLVDYTKEKKEATSNQDWTAAAKLRDKERAQNDGIDAEAFFKRLDKDVINNIIGVRLKEMAESKRCEIEAYINEAEAPIEL